MTHIREIHTPLQLPTAFPAFFLPPPPNNNQNHHNFRQKFPATGESSPGNLFSCFLNREHYRLLQTTNRPNHNHCHRHHRRPISSSLSSTTTLAYVSSPFSSSFNSSSSSPSPTTALTTATSAAVSAVNSTAPPPNQCENGKIFVYDLPSQFNSDLYKNCDKSSVWGNWCGALSNDGFGRKVTENIHLMPENLAGSWYSTDQFSSEVLFHNRLLFHKCRTLDPESATAYYIPFYAGIAVGKYMMDEFSPKDRDQHCEKMLEWVQRNYPYFNRSNGWDHFLVMGRITWDFRRYGDQGWGSRCITMPSMTNVTRLLIEKNPWDYFDVGIPYPTGFHPSIPSDVVSWQEFVRSRERRSLFCFAGGTRGWVENDFRGLLLSQCRNSSESCRLVDCSGGQGCGTSVILESFLDSEFCLQPRGDSFTRRSIFDCMLAGSIPVFFWRRSAYLQYEWFLPGESESYSVFIHRDEVRNGTLIKTVLEKYGKEEIKRMREKVVETIPKLIYAKPNEGLGSMKDAIDIAVDGVLKRIKEKKDEEINLG